MRDVLADGAVGEGAQERNLVVRFEAGQSARRADPGGAVPEEVRRPVLSVVHA